MTILVVRHGRTAANAAGELLGRRNPPLDATGEVQAAALGAEVARRVGGANAVRVVASPLHRTMATAAAIVASLAGGVEVEANDDWLELDYGTFEGRRLTDVDPEIWQRWRADPTFAPPGGESLGDVRRRVDLALAEAMHWQRENIDSALVVVSHVSPIKAAVASVLNVTDDVAWRLFLSPASITEIGLRAGGTALLGFNDVAHLSGLEETPRPAGSQ